MYLGGPFNTHALAGGTRALLRAGWRWPKGETVKAVRAHGGDETTVISFLPVVGG